MPQPVAEKAKAALEFCEGRGRVAKRRMSASLLRLRRFSSSARSRGGSEPSPPQARAASAYDSPLATLSEAERTALHALLPLCIERVHRDEDALLDARLFTPLASHVDVANAGSCLLSGICTGQGFGALSATLESISYKTCAMLIKAILQDMPQSLLVPSAGSYLLGLSRSTVSSHPLSPDSIHETTSEDSRKEYNRKIRNVLAGVPSPDLSTLGDLCALLKACAVSIDSLSYMFGPLCMLPRIDFARTPQQDKASADLLASAPAVANLMQYFIENCQDIFVQDAMPPRKFSSSSAPLSCRSRRSSVGCDSISEEDNDGPAEIQRKLSNNSQKGSVGCHSISEEEVSPADASALPTGESNSERSSGMKEETNSVIFSSRALYDFEASSDAEISISVGDVVAVVEKCEDGWWYGNVVGSDQRGLFPGSFLEDCGDKITPTSLPEKMATPAALAEQVEAIVLAQMGAFREEIKGMQSEIIALKMQLADETSRRRHLETRLMMPADNSRVTPEVPAATLATPTQKYSTTPMTMVPAKPPSPIPATAPLVPATTSHPPLPGRSGLLAGIQGFDKRKLTCTGSAATPVTQEPLNPVSPATVTTA